MNDPVDDTDFQLLGLPEHQSDTELRAREPVEVLASQFVDELRAGQKPSIDNYARRYPAHAAVIRESFPMLALLEQARVHNEAASIRRNMPEKFPFRRLGRCELLCELGRGGMGVVFQARETDSGHVVAVKVLPWRVSIVPEWQRRFEEEARITARLRHRNIVPVFRFGQEHGYCYYVMQFVNGIGLDIVIRRLKESAGVVYQDEIQRMESAKPAGFVSSVAMPAIQTAEQIDDATESRRRKLTPTSWKSFTQIAIQATQALRHAHSHRILHNDIKPANLLLDGGGRLWITDFGLSAPMEDKTGNAAQRVMGTLRFMAPERLVGIHDARSDVYSLGITLYELLTLSPAFEAGNEDDMVAKILETDPPAPRKRMPQIPRSLEMIIMNCIARHPPDRYASADNLLADLLKFSRDQKVASVRRSSWQSFLSRLAGERPPTLRDYFDR
ncbi:MAG: serine/threonine-protein kinase [Planctomycetaceae bacterium]